MSAPAASAISSSADHTYQGHESSALYQALLAWSNRKAGATSSPVVDANIKNLAADAHAASPSPTINLSSLLASIPEPSDTRYKGQSSSDIAQALVDWANKGGRPPTADELFRGNYGKPASVAASSFAVDDLVASSVTPTPVYSLSSTMSSSEPFRIVYAILLIAFGLHLAFFGWASFNWLARRRARGRMERSKPPLLRAGLAGVASGFLTTGFLALFLAAAVSSHISYSRALGANGTFGVWLGAGVLGAALCGRFKIAGRLATGFGGGASLVLIITAMFGIENLVPRLVLLSVFVPLSLLVTTIPTASRWPSLYRHALTVLTSPLGAYAFIAGIALLAPPHQTCRAWLDLITLLAVTGGTPASDAATRPSWGQGPFKGLIAGAVCTAVLSILFEELFHKNSGVDQEENWDNYLSQYADAISSTGSGRQGSFVPEPSAWEKFTSALGTGGAPSHVYQAPGQDSPLVGVAERRAARGGERHGKSKRKAGRGPAKFTPLTNRTGGAQYGRRGVDLEADMSSSDGGEGGGASEDETEYDSDDSFRLRKARLLSSSPAAKAKANVEAAGYGQGYAFGYDYPSPASPTAAAAAAPVSFQGRDEIASDDELTSPLSRIVAGAGLGLGVPRPPFLSSPAPSYKSKNTEGGADGSASKSTLAEKEGEEDSVRKSKSIGGLSGSTVHD